jgi:two-component system, LytTR family, sensor kinase
VGHEAGSLSLQQQLLVTLIVKIAVMVVLATMLVRYHRFRNLLISERRPWPARLFFAVGFGIPLALGVTARLVLHYDAADLTLEGAVLAGLMTGPWAGALVGLMLGTPPLFAAEWAALPFAVGCGFAAGGLREACPKEEIWRFSPLVFGDLPRIAWRMLRSAKLDWQVILLATPLGLELLRQLLGLRWPHRMFCLHPNSAWMAFLVFLTTVASVAVPVKIWHNARNEHRLQEQEKMLLKARLSALSAQINPHFLFNTLASISSLIRTKPETARTLILKLANIMRRQLRDQDHFIQLREELASLDEYLDIEVIRFGPQLRVDKQIAPQTLDVIVPSMILQPLIENSIKHGIAPKVGGGKVIIRASRRDNTAIIEIDDNGIGMRADRLQSAMTDGIGLSNVNERLRAIYGASCALTLTSEPGRGTVAHIELPLAPPRDRMDA